MGGLEQAYDNGGLGSSLIATNTDQVPKKTPCVTLPQILILLQATLPKRQLTVTEATRIAKYHLNRNHIAYQAHRKRVILDYLRDRRRTKLLEKGVLSL